MGSGRGRGAMEEHVEVLQYVIYIFNTIFFCAAAGVFAIGLWVYFNKDSSEYMGNLNLTFYNNAVAVVMASACLVMLTSFIGCCGAFFRFRLVLIAYKVMTVITFLLLLGGSAYLLDNGMEDTRLFPYVQEEFRNLIYRYQWDVSARRGVDIIQEQVGCCGGYSSADYAAIHLPVPDTCRDQVTGNQYIDSCGEIFSQYMEVRTGWMTGLSLSLCFLQLFAVMFAFCMWQGVREVKSGQ
ncbi:tetraspanin-2A-like [Palaemon carinicauda]|uniref:tetraspanin-2A-like n=1 Tax=Palaemon carinicauda TaxID=392227 RepID=UPI0035B61000